MAKAKAKSKTKAKRPVKKPRVKSAPKKKRTQESDWRVACKSLADVRAQIDLFDQLITPLLCKRQYFVEQAANFKPSVAGVVVQSRVEEIVQKVRAIADVDHD